MFQQIQKSFVAVFLLIGLFGLHFSSGLAQEEPPVPEGLVAPVPDSVAFEYTFLPNPIRVAEAAQLHLEVRGLRQDTCYGLPGDPIDVFFVVDNSGSAGTGGIGSNLATTRTFLQDLTGEGRQPIYRTEDGLRVTGLSRFGVIATMVSTTGTQLDVLHPLSDDTVSIQAALAGLTSGSDTELAGGIIEAMRILQEQGRPDAQPVIVLMLHDKLPLEDPDTVAATNRAKEAGIQVFLISNTANIFDEEDLITPALAARVVDTSTDFFADPSPFELREAFIQMTNGDTESAASQDIQVSVTTSPAGMLQIGDGEEPIAWVVKNLDDGERQEIDIQGSALAVPSSADGTALVTIQLAYLDCNGFLHEQSFEDEIVILEEAPLIEDEPQEAESIETEPVEVDSPTGTETDPSLELPALPDALPDIDWSLPLEWPVIRSLITPLLAPLVPSGTAAAAFIAPWLQWLLLLLLLLLLLFLLWLLWRYVLSPFFKRRKKEEPKQVIGKEQKPPRIFTILPPAWLTRLQAEQVLAPPVVQKEAADFQETLLIGVGDAGRVVLGEIIADLNHRFAGDIPDEVRFLQIDVCPASERHKQAPPAGLAEAQWILLNPNYEEVESALQNRPERWRHWGWYKNAAPTYDRARGRMGVFYDLKDGANSSRIWSGMTEALQNLETPTVRVVGTTFDDVSSGMLIDIARIAQLVKGRDIDVQLFLAGSVNQDWSEKIMPGKHNTRARGVRVSEQKARTLATLRELARFQRNLPVAFNYVPPKHPQSQLRKTHRMATIQSVFYFEPTASDSRRGGTKPENDVLTVIADALLALLHRETHLSLNTQQSRNRQKVGDLLNERGLEGVITGVNTFTIRVPYAPLAQLMGWRMVREGLFDQHFGLFPSETTNQRDGAYIALTDAYDEGPDASREAMDAWITKHEGRWENPVFALAVRKRLNALLNGEQDGGEPTVVRQGGLLRAQTWLHALTRTLKRKGARPAARKFDALHEQLENWQTFLREDVAPACQQHYATAQADLAALKEQTPRHWGTEDNLEWSVYQEKIRSWAKSPASNAMSEPLLRFAQRFGWDAFYDPDKESWSLNLLVPTRDFIWEEGGRWSRLAVPPSDADALLKALHHVAAPLAMALGRATANEIALRNPDYQTWIDKAEVAFRIRYDSSTASSEIGQPSTQRYLLTSQNETTSEVIKDALDNAHGGGTTLTFLKTQDARSLTLLSIVDYIPIPALKAYSADAWMNQSVSASMYVWEPEQIAAEMEEGQPFSAQFVSWFASDTELLEQFSLAYLYGLTEPGRRPRTYNVPGVGIVENAATPCEALQVMYSEQHKPESLRKNRAESLAMLQDAVAAKRKETANQRFLFVQQASEARLEPLAQNKDACSRNFHQYLQTLANKERKT